MAPPTPLLSIAPLRDRWFAVGALAPRRRSLLQRRGLLSLRTGISVWSLGCFSDPCVSFSRYVSFTCLAEMSLSASSPASLCRTGRPHPFALWSAAIVRLVVTFFSRPGVFEVCCAKPLFWVGPSVSAFTLAAVFLFDLASCLVVSGHTSTQTCAQGSTGLHVWWSFHALSLVNFCGEFFLVQSCLSLRCFQLC